MSNQPTQYRVTVQFPEGVQAETRTRAGVDVHRAYGYEGELTNEQLKAIKADKYLTVTKVGEDAPANRDAETASQVVKDAQAVADKLLAEAKAQADEITKAAREDADTVTKAAKEAADKITADAKAKADAAKK